MSETIGLDIGSHSIKLVGLKMTSRGPFLTRVGMKEIPCREDKEAPAFISEIIKALYREVGLEPGKVKLSVSGSGIYIRRFTVPPMSKGDLNEAIRSELKTHLPYPVESAQINFHILREFVQKDSKTLDLVAAACPTHLIDRILLIVERAGLKPIQLTPGPFALWNVLATLHLFEGKRVVALIDLGLEKTGVHLFENGILQLSREVTPAGNHITRAMMEGIDSEEGPDLIYEQAEKIKRAMGIPRKAFYEKNGDHSIDHSKTIFLVKPVLERLIAEVARSLDDYKNQFQVNHIDALFLTGGGANLKNITSYLSEELRLPVERLSPFKEILFDASRIDSQLLEERGPLFTMALGVTLPKSRQIEFLPAKEPPSLRNRIEKVLPRASALIALIVFLSIFWNMAGHFASLRKERDEKVAKVKAVETFQKNLTLLKGKETQIRQDLSLLPSSVVAPALFRRALGEVADIVPRNATLTFLSIQSEATPPKGEPRRNGGHELRMKGLVFGSDSRCLTALAALLEGLEASLLFKNAKLVYADETVSYNQPGVGFEIICGIELGDKKLEKKQ